MGPRENSILINQIHKQILFNLIENRSKRLRDKNKFNTFKLERCEPVIYKQQTQHIMNIAEGYVYYSKNNFL